MKMVVLRDEIFEAAHRWPIIVASFLVGSLIGILVSFAWPSPYRATLELAVGLNPYRVADDDYISEFAQVPFRNADDYKYWQMGQLNTLVFSDDYLDETLARLREIDTYWREVSVEELREIFQVYWRNTGTWRLAAEVSKSSYAEQAVETWRDVILEKTEASITNAQEIFLLELQIQAIRASLLKVQIRSEQLSEVEETLSHFQRELESSNNYGILDPSDRWRLLSLVSQAAGMNLGWQSLMDSSPQSNAKVEDYLSWIDEIVIAIGVESEILSIQVESLERESIVVLAKWEDSVRDGDGLAATLTVEQITGFDTVVRQLRPISIAALVGGLLGMLVWCVLILLRIQKGLES
jgi:hypothetical protein